MEEKDKPKPFVEELKLREVKIIIVHSLKEEAAELSINDQFHEVPTIEDDGKKLTNLGNKTLFSLKTNIL